MPPTRAQGPVACAPNDQVAVGLGAGQPIDIIMPVVPCQRSPRRRSTLVAAALGVAVLVAAPASGEEPVPPTTTAPPPTSTTTTTAPPTTEPGTPDDPAPTPQDPPPAPVAPPPGGAPATSPAPTVPLTEAQLAVARSEYAKLQAVADAAAREWSLADERLQQVRTETITVALSEDRARQEAQQARRQLEERAVSAYKHGAGPEWTELLAAEDISDLATRRHYVRTVVETDRALIRRSIETRERLEVASQRLEKKVGEARESENRMADLKRKMEDALEQQGFIVAKLARQSHVDRNGQGTTAAIGAVLGSVKVSGARSDDMSVLPIVDPAGRVCPVGGPTTFSNDWHAPRTGHLHQGNDLFGQYGTPLVAIADGVVFKAGDDGGLGGLRVWLRDDQGVEYYYAHMARIDVAVGQRLARGEQLGLLGNSGNARTTPPHVHFEMHPGGGAAVNPYGTVIRLC